MQVLLYILSPSYSGSTLLTFLLAAHPDLATIGELKASAMGDVEIYRCSCGSLLQECKFWKQVQQGMAEQDAPFSLADFGTHFGAAPRNMRRLVSASVNHPLLAPLASLILFCLPDYRRRLAAILQQNRRLIDLITRLQGGRVFLDGSKDPERLLQFWDSGIWDLKVIHLTRDGRGVANSYMKHYRVPMETAARQVLRVERASYRVLGKIPQRAVMPLRYEDLCSDPLGSVNRITSWAGLNPDQAPLRSRAGAFHVLGNSMRLGFSDSIKIDERWKHELGRKDLGMFERLAGNWNRRRGYK